MKSFNFYKVIITVIVITCGSVKVISQNCGNFIPLAEGTGWEMTNYDSKGKAEGTSVSVVAKSVTADGITMATVKTTASDPKGAVQGINTAAFKCTGTSAFIEMRNFIPSQSLKEMKDMSIKSDGTWIEFPHTLSAGITLNPSAGTLSIYNGSTLFATVKIEITNRKVAGKETITTAAGVFDCFKITQDITVTTTAMGMSMPATTSKSADYFSSGTGMVKSETYDKDGKLSAYSILTKIIRL